MAEGLIGDPAKVKEGMMLLLDYRWGLNRTTRLREAVQMLPRKAPPFLGVASPLNYLIEICRDFPGNSVVLLELLKKVDKERKAVWTKFEKENPNYTARRKMIVYNTRCLRLCYQQALVVESFKQGTPLSEERKAEVKAEYRKMWDKWQEEYVLAHTEMSYHDALHASAEERNARMKAMCDETLAKADPNRKITWEERKLRSLERSKEDKSDGF